MELLPSQLSAHLVYISPLLFPGKHKLEFHYVLGYYECESGAGVGQLIKSVLPVLLSTVLYQTYAQLELQDLPEQGGFGTYSDPTSFRMTSSGTNMSL